LDFSFSDPQEKDKKIDLKDLKISKKFSFRCFSLEIR